MDVPRLRVEFIEVAELTMVSLVCEDLAQNDDVATLIRSVGPTLVLTALLDGPQLASRWAARYASVLADDPGSAVLTLTSFGMVQRSRPHGRQPSPIIALWKDPGSGVREIPLEAGAHGVVLSVCMSRATRTAWAEAVAEILAYAPAGTAALLAESRSGAPWRGALGLSEPSAQLGQAIDLMSREVLATANKDGVPEYEAVLSAATEDRPNEPPLNGLVRQVLRGMLEQRRTRQPAA